MSIRIVFALVLFWQPLLHGGAVAFAQSTSTEPYLPRFARTTRVQPGGEVRALWVVRDALTSPQSIDRCVDFAVQTRFQMLFAQVRGRGDAYYRSSLEPQAPGLPSDTTGFDPLMYLIQRAQAAGIAVHAWINVFYVWSSGSGKQPEGHVSASHPEWLVTDADGVRMDERPVREWQAAGVEGYYISPFCREARTHTAEIVADIVSRYAVDGIHLDYIRFPGREFGYDPKDRAAFALAWGIDPAGLWNAPADIRTVLGAEALTLLDSLWTEWRVQQVDSAVVAIRDATGDLPLSAAVVANAVEARYDKGQDWPKWVRLRWVDFVVPMAYNILPEELPDWLRITHNSIGRDRMLVGLAVHDGRESYLEQAVNVLRAERVTGFSLFSYNVVAEWRFAASFLNDALFAGQDEEPESDEPDEEEEQQEDEN